MRPHILFFSSWKFQFLICINFVSRQLSELPFTSIAPITFIWSLIVQVDCTLNNYKWAQTAIPLTQHVALVLLATSKQMDRNGGTTWLLTPGFDIVSTDPAKCKLWKIEQQQPVATWTPTDSREINFGAVRFSSFYPETLSARRQKRKHMIVKWWQKFRLILASIMHSPDRQRPTGEQQASKTDRDPDSTE